MLLSRESTLEKWKNDVSEWSMKQHSRQNKEMIVHGNKVTKLYAESFVHDVLTRGAIPVVSNEIYCQRAMQQHEEHTIKVKQKNKQTMELHLKEVANKREMEEQHRHVKCE